MECFQPGLSFNPIFRAKISAWLKTEFLVKYSERFQSRMSFSSDSDTRILEHKIDGFKLRKQNDQKTYKLFASTNKVLRLNQPIHRQYKRQNEAASNWVIMGNFKQLVLTQTMAHVNNTPNQSPNLGYSIQVKFLHYCLSSSEIYLSNLSKWKPSIFIT